MCELIVFFVSVSSISIRKNARETVRATRALNSYLEKLAPAGVECAFFIRPLIGVCTKEITLCLNDLCELIVFFVSVSSVSIRKNCPGNR